MSLSHEHVGSKIPAKINTCMLTRAKLLFTLCYEIPCSIYSVILSDWIYRPHVAAGIQSAKVEHVGKVGLVHAYLCLDLPQLFVKDWQEVLAWELQGVQPGDPRRNLLPWQLPSEGKYCLKGPSIWDVGKFSRFLTPTPLPLAVFYYYPSANLANFWPLPL